MIASGRPVRACVAVLTAVFAVPVFAHGKTSFATNLVGYEETPSTINSPASGEFSLKISKDGSSIDYTLTYRDMPTAVTQAHIHFGRPALSGGVVLFLCTNLTPPANVPTPPPCPTPSGTVTGTLTAANVISLPATGQNIEPGAAGFAQMIKAIRNAAAYANVHTVGHGGGEIRGALGNPDDDDDDDD
jgi:hypothetical protein